MSTALWVDGLYSDFCRTFSGHLREEARRLAYTLGFAREPLSPWSQVFNHEVTLGAPAMVAEVMSNVPPAALQNALFAHVLAVIEAMGNDRIGDGQVVETPALRAVLRAARAMRDELLVLVSGGADPPLDPELVDREFSEAMALERSTLASRRRVAFRDYELISTRKQACGLLAIEALSARAGWERRRRRALRRSILGIAVGLQLYDDVIDWEEDAQTGRSWAVALTLPIGVDRDGVSVDRDALRRHVLETRVLSVMLQRASFHFRAAKLRAGALGAERLCTWAQGRAEMTRTLAEREALTPGYVLRARALAPWARAVLQL